MEVNYHHHQLIFKEPAKTSREVLKTRELWHLELRQGNRVGLGECAPLFGLSQETREAVEDMLAEVQKEPAYFLENIELLNKVPSVKFALETAHLNFHSGEEMIYFKNDFVEGKQGISINGLVWMNEPEHMLRQIDKKLAEGYKCIKLKIGALDFEKELQLLAHIRRRYSTSEIAIRVDANGAFSTSEVSAKLHRLAAFDLHSIEQPLKAGNWGEMANICENSPIPIALDEELIGVHELEDKCLLLDLINPSFLVLKPSLHGGISGCDEWIELAKERNIGWWITSYLESNIGLSAIAQWASTKALHGHQGLGTGALFVNNFSSPLQIEGESLFWRK